MAKQAYLTRKDAEGSGPFDSIEWALTVHLKMPDTKEFNVAVLHGNEDAPDKIEFWRSRNPRREADFVWYSDDSARKVSR